MNFKTAGRDVGSDPRTGGSGMSDGERLTWTIYDSPVGQVAKTSLDSFFSDARL